MLRQVEENGFSKNPGPLMIPSDESQFEQILQRVSKGDSDFQRCSRNGESGPLGESLFSPCISQAVDGGTIT
ncbi:hypothetical protein ACS0TY_033246 [Phlomoides rotata]